MPDHEYDILFRKQHFIPMTVLSFLQRLDDFRHYFKMSLRLGFEPNQSDCHIYVWHLLALTVSLDLSMRSLTVYL